MSSFSPRVSPNAMSPRVSPTSYSPSAMSPRAMSPRAMSPSAMSPRAMSPRAMSPSAMSEKSFSPPRSPSPDPEKIRLDDMSYVEELTGISDNDGFTTPVCVTDEFIDIIRNFDFGPSYRFYSTGIYPNLQRGSGMDPSRVGYQILAPRLQDSIPVLMNQNMGQLRTIIELMKMYNGQVVDAKYIVPYEELDRDRSLTLKRFRPSQAGDEGEEQWDPFGIEFSVVYQTKDFKRSLRNSERENARRSRRTGRY